MPGDRQGSTTSRRAAIVTLAVTVGSALILIAWVAFNARLLRPGADDYCLAADAGPGVLAGIADWFTTQSSYLTSVASGIALVGWPLLHLPFSIASALPFLLTAAVVGLSALTVVGYTASWRPRLWQAALGTAVLMLGWLTFIWMPTAMGMRDTSGLIGYMITNWQTVNSGYVIVAAALIGVSTIAWLKSDSSNVWIWMFLPIGIVGGLGGIALAATLFLLSVSVIIYNAAIVRPMPSPSSGRGLVVSLLGAGALIGGAVGQLSPGTRARAATLSTDLSLNPTRIGELINNSAISGFREWLGIYLNPGSVTVTVMTAVVVSALVRAGTIRRPRRTLGVALAASWVSLISVMTSRLTEQFAYGAPWHFLTARVFGFIGLIAIGCWMSGWVAQIKSSLIHPVTLMISFIGLVLITGTTLTMTIGIAQRATVWEVGPAPIPNIVNDIGPVDGMETACWNRLGNFRELPARGANRPLLP